MKRCYHCQREIDSKDHIGRRDLCPDCGANLHCCLNCVFYDTRYANACREPQADPVLEKEAGNFCEFFTFSEDQARQSPASAPNARVRLETLFKKKS